VKARTNSSAKVILCVDDEAKGLSVRQTLLESQGYRVFTAENGQDALVLFSSEDLDLVILDYAMPGMNGDVVAKKMKELKSDLPIIMLSAYVDLPKETLALVDKSLTKGEVPKILLDAIRQLLDDRHELRSSAISA
jgi:CheY-like chemotaxis protein